MANICTSIYRISGSKEELTALFNIMSNLSNSNVADGNFVGYIVEALNGSIPEYLDVRGWYDSLTLHEDEGFLSFNQESKWWAIYDAWDFICSKFKTLKAYFMSEEPGCQLYDKRENAERGWFTEDVYLELQSPNEEVVCDAFASIEDVLQLLKDKFEIEAKTIEELESIAEVWNDNDDDSYLYVNTYTNIEGPDF